MIQEFRVGKHTLLFDLQPDQFVSDANLLYYARVGQLPEPEVIAVMLRALKPGDCAVDAGANIGFFTVLMSKIVGESGLVAAVEPDPRNAAKLRKNLDINSCGNVVVFEMALGTDLGEAGLHRNEDNGQSALFGTEINAEKIRVNRLDYVIAQSRPRLLKMDIEGSEVAALKGCTFDFPYIIAEINENALKRAGTSPKDLFDLLLHRGYARFQLHANGAMPSRIANLQSVKLTRDNANMLFAQPIAVMNCWPEVEL